MNPIVTDLMDARYAILAELDNAPNSKMGSQWWVDRINQLQHVARRLKALGAE